ncbi:uncharacterized protein LOC110932569 [Helianthus annuus]|uniref:uncharacterized protein LOC110932569 n=1 Tax=Helianthus annuus TaxID=4232 RepID=UPI0016530B72|nr:uncharacterized protein LOC110932569 [Helianthus annuus]
MHLSVALMFYGETTKPKSLIIFGIIKNIVTGFAVQVLNKSAAELLKDNESIDGYSTFPKEIKSLVGKLFAYKIQVTHENIEKFDEVYDTTAISSDYSLISHVKKSLLTKQEENIAKGKRNLYELYDVDPAFPSCSTKRPIIRTPLSDISNDYLDHGDQVLTCQICSAKLWTSEGGKGRITMNKLCYGMCCGYGKVELPPLKDAHPSYQNFFSSTNEKSKFFQKNIRRYNSMFSFTSMGGKFCQLYIYDTENEITNRQTLFGKTSKSSSSNDKELDVEMIQYLRNLLDSENMLVKTYRMVRDHFHESPEANLKLRLMYKREKDGRIYNLPTSLEIAALVVGDIDKAIDHRDILVETQSGMLQRISELHPSYLALQYPLLFPYGDDGYRIDIPHRDHCHKRK